MSTIVDVLHAAQALIDAYYLTDDVETHAAAQLALENALRDSGRRDQSVDEIVERLLRGA